MDANMPQNWFDIKYEVNFNGNIEPLPYIKDICGKPKDDGKNVIK